MYIYIFLQILENFNHNVFKVFLCLILLYIQSVILMLGHFILSKKYHRLCSFRDFFSLFFSLDNFYWSILKFTESFLCCLHSDVKPIQWSFLKSLFHFLNLDSFGLFYLFSNISDHVIKWKNILFHVIDYSLNGYFRFLSTNS